jgi:hypothetical protein
MFYTKEVDMELHNGDCFFMLKKGEKCGKDISNCVNIFNKLNVKI